MGKCKDEMIKLINGEVEKVYIISEFETHYDISKSLQYKKALFYKNKKWSKLCREKICRRKHGR